MPDLHYTLWDTAPFGIVAGAEFVLFQVAQGADADHTEAFTNSRGAGALPPEESFSVRVVGAIVDYAVVTPADVKGIFRGAHLEIRVSDKTKLRVPLLMCVQSSAYSGHFTQAVAADMAALGVMGSGYYLDIPILIPGGTSFRVRVVQGAAAALAASNIRITLTGILNVPD